MVLLDVQKSIGMKRTASAGKSSSSNGSVKTDSPSHVRGSSYVLCVCNDGYPASLERRKLYRRIRDRRSEQHGLIRIIDESGEDYLYPTRYFAPLLVPQRVRRLLIGLKSLSALGVLRAPHARGGAKIMCGGFSGTYTPTQPWNLLLT